MKMKKISLLLLLSTLLLGLGGCGTATRTDAAFKANEKSVNVKLHGIDGPATAEIFGRLLEASTGVREVKRYSSTIKPDVPQASEVFWRVELDDGTNPFSLETEIMAMARAIVAGHGRAILNGHNFDYDPTEIGLLRGLRPQQASSLEIVFLLDREMAREREKGGGW